MADVQAIFQAVETLTPDEIKQLYQYIVEQHRDIVSEVSSSVLDSPRILGLHAHLGVAWMSDDFNDPLPDEFWLGEEA